MPLDALRNSLLEARDCRQALLDGMFPTQFPATVMLSLNLPGTEKTGERAERLFQWGEKALLGALKTTDAVRGCDDLGPFAIYRTRLPSKQVKRLGISLESMHPAGRLLDLDIYDHAGRPVSRVGLDIAPRACLICPEPALACIHARRHQSEELMLRARRIIDAL
ncbi:apo-citrate lyase 2'-(5''-phosphoribosyl)-3'-dephospho-coenzyme A transferase [Citrifermentans bemidjiense Bem]|uniref:citrate lyase holo-[acyl-carrier protein] synthase n=1 Tax=Citrifermentans bemidjiense (strain ATCC BAA-1014 / DSM 16622 / JCM 12645 / Bem) TaxID=404380 RepID=B5EF94_CITBB|nr:citrate lyase holo-[acyl-carrier protein] synthase [Citrifermentans bemidjiense]ACH40849.1 apo-citrate lyase 2'-(5''-phosphoribosyl)-3'-dephospho-coenzyme A transferase [Citrifermentans bemidjiense Bem]